MKIEYYKTEHFLYRQWDRGIDDATIEKITCKINNQSNKKSMIIAGAKLLKKTGVKVKRKTNLIIVSKGKVLLKLCISILKVKKAI